MIQPYFDISNTRLNLYGIFIGLAVLWEYYILVVKGPLNISSLVKLCLGGLIGARVFHILDFPSYYFSDIARAFTFWQGGFSIFGLIAGTLMVYMLDRNLRNIRYNYYFTSLLVAQSIGRIGNFLNQEIFIQGLYLYESLFCLIAFFIYTMINSKIKRANFDLSYYLTAYGIIRLITENFRYSTTTTHRLMAIGLIMLGVVVYCDKIVVWRGGEVKDEL